MSIFTRQGRSKKQELRTVSDASRDNTGGAQERKRRAAEHARYGDSAAASAASGGTKRKRPFKSVDFGGTVSGTKAPRAGLHGGTGGYFAGVNNTGVNNTGVNNAGVNYATNASGEAASSATAESSLAEQLAALLGNALSGSGGYANAGVNANTGSVSVQAPDYDSLVELFEAYLRPTYDRAIENRHQAAQTSMAELDADAYSRGMGASTFVSSMREREQDDMNSDIAMLETEYASALSEKLYEAMAAYSKLKLEADIYNAENALSASSTGRSTGRSTGSSSGRGSGKTASAGSGTGMSGKVKFGFDECKSLLGKFSTSERYDFFMSGDPYWKQMRSEMIEAIGRDRFEYLKDSYFGGAHGRHTNRDVIR